MRGQYNHSRRLTYAHEVVVDIFGSWPVLTLFTIHVIYLGKEPSRR